MSFAAFFLTATGNTPYDYQSRFVWDDSVKDRHVQTAADIARKHVQNRIAMAKG